MDDDHRDDDPDDHDDDGTGSDSREISEVLDANVDACEPAAAGLVRHGDIEVLGRMPWSSNGTFLVTLTLADGDGDGDGDGLRAQGIYKPEAGERPLWDFPAGLWRREVAASVVDDELGWGLVPPTAERDGPLGTGSVQFFVPSRFEEHYFTFKDDGRHRDTLRRICVFDVITNNTDRKGGHILLSERDRLWCIDHGLSFHEEFKLRTVMWDYAGEAIDAAVADDLMAWLERGPSDRLAELLAAAEVEALFDRTRRLVASGRFPRDPSGRRFPWPLV